MRLRCLAVLPLALSCLLAGCSRTGGAHTGLTTSGTPSTSTSATATSATPRPSSSANPRDGADPLVSGCSTGAVSLLGAVAIKMPDGKTYGILRLRASTSCHTAWGRVEAIKFRDVALHIDAIRPADHRTMPFVTTTATALENVFGRMLVYSPTSCVRARAYVQGGPVAQTACFTG